MALSLTLDAPADAVVGSTFDAAATATGVDGRAVTLTATGTDATGGSATADKTVNVTDPVTFTLTCDDPSVQIVQDGTTPGLFHVTV